MRRMGWGLAACGMLGLGMQCATALAQQPAPAPQPEVAPDAVPTPTTTPAAPASGPKLLGVGDAAPSLDGLVSIPTRFDKGAPITSFESGTIYVVDFWATWCGPCIRSMPHISDLAERYAEQGVRVLGIAIWETERSTDVQQSHRDRVASFVEKADYVRYPIAYGGDDGDLARRWMNAAGRNTIPTVFIVGRRGTILWIGHPNMGLDDALAKIVAGTFDPEVEQKLAQERENRRIVGMRMASRMQRSVEAKDWEAAVEIAGNMIDLDPQMFAPTAVSKMRMLVFELQDEARVHEFARACLGGIVKPEHKAYGDNAYVLREQAHLLLTAPVSVQADKSLALAMAVRAAAISKPDETRSFQVLAEAQAALGDKESARATLEAALPHATDMAKEEVKAALEKLK